MNKLVARQRLVMTFTFFSMFFGAGNLIFPPFVGAQAGSATIPAAIGFIVSAVGLPILGVLAVTFAGGFDKLAGRVSPKFALFLGLAIMLTIGPCFAIPRTATTSYEMMVAPFLPARTGWGGWTTQLAYSLVFFAVAFLLAQHPEKLSAVLGRFMGPLLLVMIAVLFVLVTMTVLREERIRAFQEHQAHLIEELEAARDPAISSSFWRRVTADVHQKGPQT